MYRLNHGNQADVIEVFNSTSTGVVPCGGPKKSPRTSSIVQIIFFF